MKIIAYSCPALLSIINNLILLIVSNANEMGFDRISLWYNGLIHPVITLLCFVHGSVSLTEK